MLDATATRRLEDRRLEAFGKRVDIYPQAKTRVLLFEFSSRRPRPRRARRQRAGARRSWNRSSSAKDAEARSASKWLSEQIDALRAKVAAAESRVEALRAQSGLLAGVNGVAVPSQQLSEIAAQIATRARGGGGARPPRPPRCATWCARGRLDDVASVANDESLRRYADVARRAEGADRRARPHSAARAIRA